MNLSLSLIIIFGSLIATYAEAQYGYFNPLGYGNPGGYNPYNYPVPYNQPNPNLFRAGYPQPSIEENVGNSADTRIFLGTVTITLATTTSTKTITTSTTCTTSAKAISICSPSGRRRRGLGLNLSPKARGLFYNDEEDESETGSIFTRSDDPKPDVVVVLEIEKDAEHKSRSIGSTSPMIPFVVQPGFNAPEGVRGGRFLVAFGTSTSVITTTSTYTAILTAACKSTTNFSTCSGTGK